MTNQAIETRPPSETTGEFLGRVCATIDAGAQAVMLSIGHRSGLLDAMASLPPADSATIADAAGLAERYVREWLAVMVTARVVEYDPSTGRYELPAHRAACLTRDGTAGNMAVYAQVIPLIGAAQDRLLECLRSGEGTRYEDYPSMHAFMCEDSGQTVVARLFDEILPMVDGIEQRLSSGIDVLDAGCGRGLALLALARRYPNSRFTGYDLCADAIDFARERAGASRLENVYFQARDLSHFDEVSRYDLVTTFDAVHDQKDPAELLRRLHRALKPGGQYLMQDIGGSSRLENNLDFPMASLLYAVSFAHCTPVSIGQGGKGLGTMWGWETAERLLAEAGFTGIRRQVFEHDPMNVWFVSRRA